MNKSKQTSKIESDAGIFPWLTYLTMKDMGLDADKIFDSVNVLELPYSEFNKNGRFDNRIQEKFWATAESVSGNRDVGLIVGSQLPKFRGQILEYLFLSSSTFGEGLQSLLKYSSLFTSALQCRLEIKGEDAYLFGFEHPIRHYVECTICLTLSLLKHVSNEAFQPTEIWLTYNQGASAELYQQIFGCPVYLTMPEGCIKFDAQLLDKSSAAADPDLHKLHESMIEKYIDIIEKQELVFQIESVLDEQLKLGHFKLEDIAKALDKSPRALRAALEKIDTGYEKVLNDYRQKLARDLLENTDLKSDEVVYRTGFSEPSAFSRAFKYWTGETPSQYRKRKRTTT